MAQAITQASARIRVLINNATVGFVTGFNWSINYGKTPLRGIDSPFPQEIAPGQQSLRGTISCIRLRDVGLEDYGIVAEQGVTTHKKDGPRRLSDQQVEKYISLTLIDRGSGKILFKVDRATVTSQSWSIAPKGIVTGSFEFEAFMATPLSS